MGSGEEGALHSADLTTGKRVYQPLVDDSAGWGYNHIRKDGGGMKERSLKEGKGESDESLLNEKEFFLLFKRESRLLKAFFTFSPDALFVIDRKGRFQEASMALARLLKVKSPEDLKGKTLLEVVDNETTRHFFGLEESAMESGQTVKFEEKWIGHPLGRPVWGLATMVPLKGKNGRVQGLFGILKNITVEKRSQQVQQAIFRIAQATHTSHSLRDLYREIHKALSELLDTVNFFIAYKEEGECFSFPYYVDQYDLPPEPRRMGRGLTEYVFRTGVPLLADDAEVKRLVAAGEVEDIGTPSVSWLGVPLRAEGKSIGVLVVQSYSADKPLIEEDKEILNFVSGKIALAINTRAAWTALEVSEERYRTLTENLPVGIFRSSPGQEGVFLMANPAMVRILGYESEREMLGKPVADHYFRPLDRGVYSNELIAGGEIKSREILMARKDGRPIWASISARAVKDSRGSLLYFDGTLEDITRRKEAEERFRESEERWLFALEGSGDGVWDWDVPSGKVFCSTQWRRMFYLGEEGCLIAEVELSGRIHPEDFARVQEEKRSHLAGEAPLYSTEYRLLDGQGNFRWVLARGKVMARDGEGKPLRMVGTHTDITSRKLVEEERSLLILQLKQALGNVKALSGLLPICASCKKIRDDRGYWQQVEVYIRDHSEADFSHSLCPECMEKLYPGITKGRQSPPR